MAQKSRKGSPPFVLYVASMFVLAAALTLLIASLSAAVFLTYNGHLQELTPQMKAGIIVGSGFSLLVSIALGIVLAKSITRPLRVISDTAQQLTEGDLSARTNLQGADEISRLGQTFDEMADSLENDRNLERQLIGDVAHELRTPLMAIQSTVEAIQDGIFEADEERLNTINSETRRLGRLVEGLLQLNRLENGRTQLKCAPMDISLMAQDLVKSHEALTETMNITLTSKIEPNIRVVGDQDMLHMSLANLLSNAVRYTPEGGSIMVSAVRSQGYAVMAVTDTGIGISEEDQEHVFSRFWRADQARATATGGLGIGLSMVKEIVDQHHGYMELESTLGEGSTFFIYLPLASDDPAVIASMDKDTIRRAQKAAKREQERIRKEQERQRKEMDRRNRATAKEVAAAQRKLQERQKAEEAARKKQEEAARALEVQRMRQAGRAMPAPASVTSKLFKFRIPLVRPKDENNKTDNQR